MAIVAPNTTGGRYALRLTDRDFKRSGKDQNLHSSASTVGGCMNVLARWSIGVLICRSVFSSRGADQSEDGFAERVIRSHATFLNEISDRRRLNSIFPNEQSSL